MLIEWKRRSQQTHSEYSLTVEQITKTNNTNSNNSINKRTNNLQSSGMFHSRTLTHHWEADPTNQTLTYKFPLNQH